MFEKTWVTGPCSNLVTLPQWEFPRLVFGATTDQSCVGPYTVMMKVGDGNLASSGCCWWSPGFTATFSYVADPCASATFVQQSDYHALSEIFHKDVGTTYSHLTPRVFATTPTSCALTNAVSTEPAYFSYLTATVNSDGSMTISLTAGTDIS